MHDLPVSVNYGVILPFHETLQYEKFREYKNLVKISKFTVLYSIPYFYFFVLKCYMLITGTA